MAEAKAENIRCRFARSLNDPRKSAGTTARSHLREKKRARIPRYDNEISSASASRGSKKVRDSRSPPASGFPKRLGTAATSPATLFRARNSLIPLAARRGGDARATPIAVGGWKKVSRIRANPRDWRKTAAAAARQTDAGRGSKNTACLSCFLRASRVIRSAFPLNEWILADEDLAHACANCLDKPYGLIKIILNKHDELES